MRLTRYTDYALRVLMHLAARPERLATIGEMARVHRISQNHLMKVVHDLRKEGYLEAVRGRAGGVRLARPAADIVVGAVVRHTEESFDLVDCGSCVIARACSLTGVLNEALRAFLSVLDRYTLADLVASRAAGMQSLAALLANSGPDDRPSRATPTGAATNSSDAPLELARDERSGS
jgi:Rrf2 family nitric oxide-sensitive transcriptional repressor